MEYIAANMIVMIKMNPTEYGCKLQGFPTTPQFAISRSDVVCLITGINFALFEMSKGTNLDIKDAAYLHIVHNLQHPTSRPTTKSTKTTMVNAPKNNFSPLPAGRYRKLKKRSTQRRHQANEGKSGFEAERILAVGALRSLRSKKKLAVEKR